MKKKKALIAIDDTDLSYKVLKIGLEWCNSHDYEPIIMHCYEPISYYYGAEFDYGYNSSLITEMKKKRKDSIKLRLADFSGKFTWKEGNPVDSIVEEANKRTYSLLIMGNSGKGFFERLVFGYKLDQVLKRVDKDILMVSRRVEGVMRKGVGLDFSEETDYLLDNLNSFAKKNESLSLISLITPMTAINIKEDLAANLDFSKQMKDSERIIKAKIRKIKEKLSKQYRVKAIVAREMNNKVDELMIKHIKKNRLNTIMVGPHKRTIMDRIFLLSVTDQLIKSGEVHIFIKRH